MKCSGLEEHPNCMWSFHILICVESKLNRIDRTEQNLSIHASIYFLCHVSNLCFIQEGNTLIKIWHLLPKTSKTPLRQKRGCFQRKDRKATAGSLVRCLGRIHGDLAGWRGWAEASSYSTVLLLGITQEVDLCLRTNNELSNICQVLLVENSRRNPTS